MRTAVVRIGVDPSGVLSADQLRAGIRVLAELADAAGIQLIENDLAAMPVGRREVELLTLTDDPDTAQANATRLCATAFGTSPVAGVLTFISRGTDDDAEGVLTGFGILGDIERWAGPEGWDVVQVTLRKADLERVPESRIHTALEATLNCEVRILVN